MDAHSSATVPDWTVRVFLAACTPGGRPSDDDLSRLDGESEWSSLLDLAEAHGAVGLLVDRLRRLAASGRVPAARIPSLEDVHLDGRRRTALVDLQTDAALAAIAARDLPVCLLKGAALRLEVYPDPAVRDMRDIDLLVRRDDVGRAVEALAPLGYLPPRPPGLARTYLEQHFHLPLYGPRRVPIELHWGLTRSWSSFSMSPDATLSGPRLLRVVDRPPVNVPSLEQTLLHIVIQQIQEGFSRLSRTVDVDRIVRHGRSFDWTRVVRDARAGNLGASTYLALRLAVRWFDTPVPDGVLTELRPSAAARFHLRLLDPFEATVDRRYAERFSPNRLRELWLLPDGASRWKHLHHVLVSRYDSIDSLGDRSTPAGIALKLAKLVAAQVALYVSAWPRARSRRARRSTRLRSSQASTSDRL